MKLQILQHNSISSKDQSNKPPFGIHHRFPHVFLEIFNSQLTGKSGKSKGGRKGRGKGQPVEGEETLGDEELEDWVAVNAGSKVDMKKMN